MTLKHRVNKLDGGNKKEKMFVVIEGGELTDEKPVINKFCKETGLTENELLIVRVNRWGPDSTAPVKLLNSNPIG